MRNLQPWEIIVILAVVVLLFGAKRLPDTARGLGRSLRILKAETKGLREDDDVTTAKSEPVVVEPRPLQSGAAQPVAQPVVQPVAQPHTTVQRDAADR